MNIWCRILISEGHRELLFPVSIIPLLLSHGFIKNAITTSGVTGIDIGID